MAGHDNRSIDIGMKHYEVLCILPGTLSEDELVPHVEKITEIIAGAGGTELSLEPQGKSRLAYPIKHIRYGYFYLGYFQAEPDQIGPMQEKMRLTPELLRAVMQTYDPQNAPARRITPYNAPISQTATPEDSLARLSSPKAGEKSGAQSTPSPQDTDTPATSVSSSEDTKEKETKVENIKIEDIDKKLDQLLETDIADV